VRDYRTGLVWQQSGSSEGKTFADAEVYIQQINDENYGGFSNWRLPTLEEAMSLMQPKKSEDGLFINPVFDKTQSWIWTSDTYSASRPWGVLFDFGGCYDFNVDDDFVRAVR